MNAGRKRRFRFATGITAFLLLLIGVQQPWVKHQWRKFWEPEWQRPYGMAPAAFNAFTAACRDSKISPERIGQTIGDAPLSVGYHRKDGVLIVHGQRIDYCAAVDLGAFGLNRKGINFFLHNLTKHGFACWYREKGHWKNREHIHAVYASLPMKSQLSGQVKQFLNERRSQGIAPLPWERKVARHHFALIALKK